MRRRPGQLTNREVSQDGPGLLLAPPAGFSQHVTLVAVNWRNQVLARRRLYSDRNPQELSDEWAKELFTEHGIDEPIRIAFRVDKRQPRIN